MKFYQPKTIVQLIKRTNKLISHFLFVSLSIMFFCNVLEAQIPSSFNYQGVLHQDGEQVSDGTYEILLSLHDQATDGNILWSETQQVSVTNGVFNTQIGIFNPMTIDFDVQMWLGITIDDEELLPRVFLASVPYSLMAKTVEDNAITSEKIAEGELVKSFNGLKDNVTLTGGENITIETQGENITINALAPAGGGSIEGVIPEDALTNPVGYGSEIITIDPANIVDENGEDQTFFSVPSGKTIRIMKDYPNTYIRYVSSMSSNAPPDPEDCPYPATENCNTYIPLSKDLLITDLFYDPNFITEQEMHGEIRILRDEIEAPYTTIAFYTKTGPDQYQECGPGNGGCGLKIFAAVVNTVYNPFMFFNYWEGSHFHEFDPDGQEISEYVVPEGKKLVVNLLIIKSGKGIPIHTPSSITYDGKVMTTDDIENDVIPIPFIFNENTHMTFQGEVKLVGYLK